MERKDALRLAVPRDALAVEDTGFDVRGDVLSVRPDNECHLVKRLDQVGVLGGVVLAVPAEDLDGAVGQLVDLRAFSVVLVFAREQVALEAIQHLRNALRGLRQHRLHGDAWRQVAVLVELRQRVAQQRGNDRVVRRTLADDLLQQLRRLRQLLLQLCGVGGGGCVEEWRRERRRRRCERDGVCESCDDRLLRQTDPQLSLEAADDVLDFLTSRGHHQTLDDAALAVLRLAAFHFGEGLEILEERTNGQRRRREDEALRGLAREGDVSQISALLHGGFDVGTTGKKTATRKR